MTEPEPGTTVARLWALLPAVHRLRDAETGGVLAELLDVFGDQLDVPAEELAQLYDDQFVETAAPWAAPYLGELVGYLGRFEEAKRRLILINPAERVRRLLQVAQLDDLFPTFDSVDAALAAHPG